MKTLIVYASKNGCTSDCVHHLQTKLKGDVTVVNATKKFLSWMILIRS